MIRLFPRLFLFVAAIGLFACSDDSTNAPATYTISGTVHKAGTGSPIPDAVVVATGHDDGREVGRTSTGTDGVFTLKGLPAGAIDITASADGYASVLFAALDPKKDASSLGSMSVQLAPSDSCCSGLLILRVKNGSGELLANKAVVIKKAGQIIADPRTDSGGKVMVADLCPGEYSIRIAVDGYRVYEAVFVINAACEPVELTAVLQNEAEVCCDGVLTVNVKDENGAGVSGAKVRVWKSGAILHTAFTDGSGAAVFTDLCKGEYGVEVMKTGYTNREFSFAINGECDPVTKNVVVESLGCCSGVLTVTVTDANSNPIEGATVKLWKGGAVKETAQTNAQGVAVIDGICKGEYGVSVLKSGYQTREFTFAIGPDCGPYAKSLVLEP
ncbi:MAG: carboxypeptidase regulatory-like domain-containing protein [Bacteroidetes bacterium]|nr:carboxypeptidase regulatory-like domain-containing protein [Bacteroidota bacterium]